MSSENGNDTDAAEGLRTSIEEFQNVVLSAVHELQTKVLEHYHRTTERLDEHARRIRIIEERIGITGPPPGDGL